MANRTQVAGRLASLPAPIVTAVTPGYNGPNVPISYEQANGFQEAVCRPLEDGGVVLDKDNYDQFAELLSGVHAIKSNIRSDVETTGVTTVATSAAVACSNTICSGLRSFAGGGRSNTNSGPYSASSGGSYNTNSGTDSASSGGHTNTNSGDGSVSSGGFQNTNSGGGSASCGGGSNTNSGGSSASSGGFQNTNSGGSSASSGGFNNTNSGNYSASSGGGYNTNSGNYSASSGGISNTNSGNYSASVGGYVTYNSGERAINCASKYAENIDDNCAFGGYAAAAPANHGDGLTNKNIKWKLHNDTGNAEFAGNLESGSTVGGLANKPIGLTKRALTASVDWATAAAEIECVTPVVDYDNSTTKEIALTIANSDSGSHDIELGSSVLIDISGITATGGTLVAAYAKTTAGSTNAQKGLRWSCGEMLDSSGDPKLAVTSTGKTTAVIGAVGSGESVTVKIYLTYAALSAV